MKTLGSITSLVLFVGSILAQTEPPIVSEQTIKADLAQVVCKDKDRLEAVKKMFALKGASAESIQVDSDSRIKNVLVTKKGKSNEMIVIGAHYDKVPDGCGAIDNWTGIVIIANLYATFLKANTDKTFLFVAFDKEEDGLVGSRAMAKAIPKEARTNYCSMVNFDSFGFHYPQVLSNVSSSRMTAFAKELAAEAKMPFSEASLAGVADADSSSFLDRDIPAITFHGLSNKWADYLHTSRDKLEAINILSVLVGYRFAALFLNRLDPKPCGTFRRQS